MDTLENIGRQMSISDDYVIVGHSIPDGDSVGSILALYQALITLGKRVTIIMQDPLSSVYDYLPMVNRFCRPEDIDIIPKNVILLDCSRLDRIGEEALKLMQDRQMTINIDHHQDNDTFGDLNYVDPLASSAAEIIYELLTVMEINISKEIADCLYAGIVMDTGSFMNTNTTSTTMRIAAALLEKGADTDLARNNLLESKPHKEVLLLGLGLKHLEFHHQGKIACMKLPFEEVRDIDALDIHPEGTINYVRSIKGVEVALLFREVSPGLVKIGYRSKNRIDVAALANKLGGGGHKRAAGAQKTGALNEVGRLVIEMVEDVLD
ncbi:3'-to-5' oligoribonuclease a [hydrocarbon metagenome]|uniref:3'-to-5' oligoribonuclease a n=1 Tax=hydrocarbon metagenome TaxID=938273 RepID=A0A0W8E2Q8_9ZZZZ